MINKNHMKTGMQSRRDKSREDRASAPKEGGFHRRNLRNAFDKNEKTDDKKTFIYGKHAVLSAMLNRPDCVEALFLTSELSEEKAWKDIISDVKSKNVEAGKNKIEVHVFEEKNLPRDLLKEIDNFATHQGCMAKIDTERLVKDGKKFIEDFKVEKTSCFIILGEITDVQNVGSILRSAAGFAVDAVIMPEHNQAPITGAVIKISAGNAFTLPLLTVGNVNQSIKELKDKGFWIYGLDTTGTNIYDEKFTEASVFVIGNESKGIREKTMEACDIIISIPINKNCESLNAAVSTAVALSEFRRQNTNQ
jgi:23S rRNA (guanosine2251-2'-O)-methyltransferase